MLLRDQDRSLWDLDQIEQARWRSTARLLWAAVAPTWSRPRSRALHTDDPQDWPQIAALYGELARLTGSPVVELNRAAAIAEAGDPAGALDLVDRLELDRYHYLHATRAELLRRLDRVEESIAAYDRALELVHSDAERRFLERRRAELRPR